MASTRMERVFAGACGNRSDIGGRFPSSSRRSRRSRRRPASSGKQQQAAPSSSKQQHAGWLAPLRSARQRVDIRRAVAVTERTAVLACGGVDLRRAGLVFQCPCLVFHCLCLVFHCLCLLFHRLRLLFHCQCVCASSDRAVPLLLAKALRPARRSCGSADQIDDANLSNLPACHLFGCGHQINTVQDRAAARGGQRQALGRQSAVKERQ